jgi:hypothetical protein
VRTRPLHLTVVGLVGALGLLVAATAVSAQPVSVTAADPSQGEQNVEGLPVRLTGKNFAAGARVDFFRSGTSDPAGIVVRSAVVTTANEIQATIDIAPDASLSLFDIRVTNLSGRSGKGSDLFQVVEKGNKIGCTVPTVDPRVSLIATFNGLLPSGAPRYKSALGFSLKTRQVVINGIPTLMVVVNADPGAEVFFLTPDGSGGVAIDVVNPHRRLDAPTLQGLRITEIGDLNGDGAPDVVSGNRGDATGAVFAGRWEDDGTLAFNPPVAMPANLGFHSVAVGDIDPLIPGDEIAVGAISLAGKKPGGVYLLRLSGSTVVPLTPSFVTPTTSPALAWRDEYARSIAIADVTGSSDPDLIVSARTLGNGEVHVFPGPATLLDASVGLAGRQPLVIRPVTDGHSFGAVLGAGDVNNDGTDDVVATLRYPVDVTRAQAALGPIGPSHVVDVAYETEVPGGADSGPSFGALVAADLDGDGINDLAGGSPNACLGGKAFVWPGTGLAATPWAAPIVLMAATTGGHYGWTVASGRVGTLSVMLVGETQRTIGGYASAGQIYVYRVTQ